MLATLGGNTDPSSSDIAKILKAGQIQADEGKTSKVVSELKGKNVETIVSEGMKKFASIPAGSSSAPQASTTTAAPPAAASVAKEDAKKKPAKEESDEEMGFGLFD